MVSIGEDGSDESIIRCECECGDIIIPVKNTLAYSLSHILVFFFFLNNYNCKCGLSPAIPGS